MNLNDTRDSAEYKINNDKQREIISNIYIGDCIRQLNITLENINKNLEKIANNTEKQDKVSIPTIQAIGNFFAEETKKIKEVDINTIICNKNKDSHVDKNIILD